VACASDPFAKTLLYSGMRRYVTSNAPSKKLQRWKYVNPVPGYLNVNSADALGCIYTIHPSNDECFYRCLLLVNVRGPIAFELLRTVDSELCAIYREAC